MKTILSQILLSIFLLTDSAAMVIQDKQINTEIEIIKPKFSEKLNFLVAQNNRLSCNQGNRYRITPNGKEYYYNLILTIRVIQYDMTYSDCIDAVREIESNNVACIKNGYYLSVNNFFIPYYNLVSNEGVIKYNMSQSSCFKAASEF